jgi:hypothetical protein
MIDFVVNENDKGRGLYAKIKFSRGTRVLILQGNYLPYPTKTSIQIGKKHIESWEGGHVNHACDPNTIVVTKRKSNAFKDRAPLQIHCLEAVKDIEIGEEITFDYETTEERMAEPFKCSCHGRLIDGYWGYLK